MEKPRYLTSTINTDALSKGKMAFISGPRQVGKSTLAKKLLSSQHNYFLYDDEIFRKSWNKSPPDSLKKRDKGPVVLDEIHKDRLWKRKVKGIYDKSNNGLKIIVTGSARFNHYRKGSDSLLGRYLPYRLHPFSLAESKKPISPDEILSSSKVRYSWHDLMNLGGFPEPLLGANSNQAMRWSRLRLDRLVLEDSRDFRNISDYNAFRNLAELLPEKIGSLLSVNSLREDVGKAYATVREWLQVLDLLYFSFLIRPYSKRVSRAIRSEPKLYLYDILRIPHQEQSKRQENLTALHLLKMCQFWTDSAQGEFDLHFVRNKEGRELDFLVVRNKKPWMAIECKSGDKSPAKDLIYFSRMLKPECSFQLVADNNFDRYFASENIRVISYQKFFAGML